VPTHPAGRIRQLGHLGESSLLDALNDQLRDAIAAP
jgi:hypothetical protein